MKLITRATLLLVLLVNVFTLCLAQEGNAARESPSTAIEYDAANWKVFFAIDAGFHVKMPGKPTQSSVEVATPVGNLPHHVYSLRTEAGAYMVTYTEFPSLRDDPQEIKQMLEALPGTKSKDKNKKLLSDREVIIEGYTGREFLIEAGDNIVRSRAFLTRSRVYEMTLSVPRMTAFKTRQPSSDPFDFTDFYKMITSQFFESFKLINGGSATSVNTRNETVDGRKTIVSGGVINGRATKLPRPSYPSSARAAGVQGTVAVRVLINEDGKVIEAKAVSGDPALRAAAENAARSARFTTTKLKGVPVKVSGIINYHFRLH